MIVVLSALVINTVVDKGPIIFLKLAEMNEGQYDGIIYPSKSFSGVDKYSNVDGIFINYTRVQEVVESQYNLAPRKQFCSSTVASDLQGTESGGADADYYRLLESEYVPTSDGGTTLPTRDMVYDTDRNYAQQACVMFMDTQRERDIDLGSSYQWDPMGEGRCMIEESMAETLGVQEEDLIYVKLDMYQNLIALIGVFNDEVAGPSQTISRSEVTVGTGGDVQLPCRVAHIGLTEKGGYGKLPKEAAPEQIIMEYEPFLAQLAEYLPAGGLRSDPTF